MKRKIYFITCLYFLLDLLSSLFAEDIEANINNYIRTQKNNIIEIQMKSLENEIYKLNLDSCYYKWSPDLNLKTNLNYDFIQGREKNIHDMIYSSTLNFSQKIPLGMNLTLDLFEIQFNYYDEFTSDFNFLGEFTLEVPLISYVFGFGKDILWAEKNKLNILNNNFLLENKLMEKNITNLIYSGISEYLFINKSIELYNKKLKYMNDKLNLLNRMMLENQISFDEYINLKNEITKLNSEINLYEKQNAQIIFELKKTGCDPDLINFSLDDWLTYLERNIDFNQGNDFQFLDYQLEDSRINNNIISKIELCDNFPKLNISLDINPRSRISKIESFNDNLLESFYAYWPSLDICNVDFSVWMKINLSNKKLNSEKKILEHEISLLELRKKELFSDLILEENYRLSVLYNAKSTAENSLQIYEREKSFYPSINKMFTDNVITSVDLLEFGLYIDDLYLDYVENYLYYVNLIISFY